MNHPHESQAAAMARAGELPDGEQLRECVNSGQVSAAQVVAHQQAGEAALQKLTAIGEATGWPEGMLHAGELPELPASHSRPSDLYDIYSADQMRSYAVAARSEAMQEAERYRADAERFAWWFNDSDDKSGFLDSYLEGLTEHWGLENWRKAIDGAMAEHAAATQQGANHE